MNTSGSGPVPRKVYQSLDLLRGIAALAVVGRHLEAGLAGWLPSSSLAVDLFFVLSGFVIQHAYSARLEQGLGLAAFMRLRVIRLYPLYVLGTAIGAAIFAAQMLFGLGGDVRAALASLVLGVLFLPAWRWLSADHAHLYPFDFPSWSLFWELVINLLYAVIVRKLGWRLLVALLWIGAAMLFVCAGWYGQLSGGSNFTNAASGGLRVVYSFFAGVAIYRIRQAGLLRGLRLPPVVAGAILIVILALRPEPAVAYDLAAILIAFPLLVFASTGEPQERPCRACAFLGRISYPIYVLHIPVLTAIAATFAKADYWWHGMQGIQAPPELRPGLEMALVAGVVGLAWLADRLVDQPARQWLLHKTSGR